MRTSALTVVLAALAVCWGGLLLQLLQERSAGARREAAPPPVWGCAALRLVVGDVASPGLHCLRGAEGETALLARLDVTGCALEGTARPPAAGAEMLEVHVGDRRCTVRRARLPAAALHALRQPLDANRASAAELEGLPGIGRTLARRIVEQRELHGPYARIEDLERVDGVGPALLRRLRNLLEVTP